MPGEQAFAERQTEAFDLCAGMLSGGRVDEALQRLTGEESGRFAFDERIGEVTLETAADSQIASVVPIAAADDPQHAEMRFAMAAGADAEHAATIAQESRGPRRSGQGGVSRIMSD